jgi:uncharacterized protein YnzC (UPF0291/DUF896 family)
MQSKMQQKYLAGFRGEVAKKSADIRLADNIR